MRSMRRSFLLLYSIAGLALVGCESTQHRVAPAAPMDIRDGVRIGCKLCYDQTRTVSHAKGVSFKQRVHQCPDCKTDVSLYSEGGVAKMKCANCAPEGVACNRCLPPEGS